MQSIIKELSNLIDKAPNVASSMQIITDTIMVKYPMEVDDYYDLDHAKIMTHWQHIIFDQIVFGADYIYDVDHDPTTDINVQQEAQQMKKNPTTWYTLDYQLVTKSHLKSIVKHEFNQALSADDCLDDWDQVAATDILNAELSLTE